MKRRRRDKAKPPPVREWVGGAFTLPAVEDDEGEPYRPRLVLWIEMPDAILVGRDVFMPDDETAGAVARVLREAVAAPKVGPPRRPDAIRVSDAATAAAVDAEMGGETEVTVAPTPELDERFERLRERLSGEAEEQSYVADGRVPVEAVEDLFEAAANLYAVQPWTLGSGTHLLGADIPELGVETGCAWIMGAADEPRGLLVYPSFYDFADFAASFEPDAVDDDPELLDAQVLVLTFVPATALPRAMRREAMEHGWRVSAVDAYPFVQRRDPTGAVLPLSEHDVQVVTACASALSAFAHQHASALEAEDPATIRESYRDPDGPEVRLTFPYEEPDFLGDFLDEDELSGLADPEDLADLDPDDFTEPLAGGVPDFSEELGPFEPRAGRNEPCPCGSGRKYKKCHLPAEEARHAKLRQAKDAHAMDARLTLDLLEFASEEHCGAWPAFRDDLAGASVSMQLLLNPLALHSRLEGEETVAEAYVERHGRRCSPEERRWLNAQQAAWLSVWEAEAVEPGESLALRDLLSGERRTVLDRQASRSIGLRAAFLGRVVDYRGLSLLSGAHPNLLPPFDAADFVDRARDHLPGEGDEGPERAVTTERITERLRDATVSSDLLLYWREVVTEMRDRNATPPDVRNRDGDPLVFATDTFEIAPGKTAEVEAHLREIEGIRQEETDDDATLYVLLRPDEATPETEEQEESTVLGWIRLESGTLRVETNSEARADALRERIESACGGIVRHGGRECRNPLSLRGPRSEEPAAGESRTLPEDAKYAAEHKARHYASWPDIPLPALDGQMPRECARTAEGQRRVDLVIKHMENLEDRMPGDARFDFSILRKELGIPTT